MGVQLMPTSYFLPLTDLIFLSFHLTPRRLLLHSFEEFFYYLILGGAV